MNLDTQLPNMQHQPRCRDSWNASLHAPFKQAMNLAAYQHVIVSLNAQMDAELQYTIGPETSVVAHSAPAVRDPIPVPGNWYIIVQHDPLHKKTPGLHVDLTKRPHKPQRQLNIIDEEMWQ